MKLHSSSTYMGSDVLNMKNVLLFALAGTCYSRAAEINPFQWTALAYLLVTGLCSAMIHFDMNRH